MSFGATIERRRAAVPLAPMLDILFLLIIFFVTTSSFHAEEQRMEVDLPKALTARPAEAVPTQVVINVKADGQILVGPQVYQPDALLGMLRELLADYPNEQVIIRGDRDTRHHRIMKVMDVAQLAGVQKVHIAVVKPAAELSGG